MTIKGPRDLPKMDDLLKDPQLDSLKQTQGYLPVKEAVRSLLEAARQTLTGRRDRHIRTPYSWIR